MSGARMIHAIPWSELTLRQAKKQKIDLELVKNDLTARKQLVDKTFEKLLSKILVPAPEVDFFLTDQPALKSSSGTEFVGKIVALLSTGETGLVIDKPGSKCIVKLDKDGSEIKACRDELYWIKNCANAEDAVQKIIKASQYVPQDQDLTIGARVAIIKLHYQTARIIKLPDLTSKKNCCFVLQLDHARALYKSKAEGLRLISSNNPVIGPLCGKRGRPPAGWAKSQRKLRRPEMLIPISKSSEAWKQSVRPPKVLPPLKAVSEDAVSSSDDDGDQEFDDDEQDAGSEGGDAENDPFAVNEFWL